jgi:DGQHR domain-containing protein
MSMKPPRTVQRYRALRLQHPSQDVFLLGVSAADILQIAGITRLRRDGAGDLAGYQRPLVKRHIADIVDYLDSEAPLFPNCIIIAFGPTVQFMRTKREGVTGGVETGFLLVPDADPDGQMPGWIVDGQQRAVALSQCGRPDLLVPVSAFITGEVEMQRDQFLRINNTKPLPRGLINELLPALPTDLPERLEKRRAPSLLCDLLNEAPSSPFRGLIRRASTPKAERRRAVVADTSLISAIEENLNTPGGSLFSYHNIATGEVDVAAASTKLQAYWSAVQRTFPEAWGLPPVQSRLMHGVGIRSMGRLMNLVMRGVDSVSSDATEHAVNELASLKSLCHWTSGRWDGLGGLAWNELQNTPGHVRAVSAFLQDQYLSRRYSA